MAKDTTSKSATKHIGAEVPMDQYRRLAAMARATHRSRSSLLRYLIENMDVILDAVSEEQ